MELCWRVSSDGFLSLGTVETGGASLSLDAVLKSPQSLIRKKESAYCRHYSLLPTVAATTAQLSQYYRNLQTIDSGYRLCLSLWHSIPKTVSKWRACGKNQSHLELIDIFATKLASYAETHSRFILEEENSVFYPYLFLERQIIEFVKIMKSSTDAEDLINLPLLNLPIPVHQQLKHFQSGIIDSKYEDEAAD